MTAASTSARSCLPGCIALPYRADYRTPPHARRAVQVGHDEADRLGHVPPRLGPALGLVAEAGVEPPDLMGPPPHRALEQIADVLV